jgi:hypothetical protein
MPTRKKTAGGPTRRRVTPGEESAPAAQPSATATATPTPAAGAGAKAGGASNTGANTSSGANSGGGASTGGGATTGGGASTGSGGLASALATSLRGLLTKENLTKLGTAARRAGVSVTRHGLVPLAESYARVPAQERMARAQMADTGNGAEPPPADHLTVEELAALSRAGNKLVLESGDLLVARFPPSEEMRGKVVDRTPDATGYRGEPSLAMAVAAVKGARTVLDERAARKADETRQAEIKTQAVELQPVSVNLLRVRNRG